MKKKIVVLALALTAALGAQLSAAPTSSQCFMYCPCPEDPTFCVLCCPQPDWVCYRPLCE